MRWPAADSSGVSRQFASRFPFSRNALTRRVRGRPHAVGRLLVPVRPGRTALAIPDVALGLDSSSRHSQALRATSVSDMQKHTSVPAMIDGVRRILRTRGYSTRSVTAYLAWIERFLRYHDGPHWRTLGSGHAEAFLHHLANGEGLSPNSRNQAASALAFLYREVLRSDAVDRLPRARGPKTVPVVMSHGEAMRVLNELRGKYQLAASLMYGAGLRVMEVVNLRIKDLDFDLLQIAVRGGKGAKDRMIPLPVRARQALSLCRQSRVREHSRCPCLPHELGALGQNRTPRQAGRAQRLAWPPLEQRRVWQRVG